jgi:virginiamycin A acetyltransferase
MSIINTTYPDPATIYPVAGIKRLCFLKNIITNPQIIVGDYTYYDDPEDVYNFQKNVLYLFDFIADKLIIEKFCQIASQTKFIMNGANHSLDGFSTYPFKIFGKSWENALLQSVNKGDTIVGNDVWIGNSAVFMPGVKIGDGAIIASHSIVTKDVDPYTIVGGNPAREIRQRFDEKTVLDLLKLQWWNLPIEVITQHLDMITSGNISKLIDLISKQI